MNNIEPKFQIRMMSMTIASTVAVVCYSDRNKPPQFQEIVVIAEMIEDWIKKAKE